MISSKTSTQSEAMGQAAGLCKSPIPIKSNAQWKAENPTSALKTIAHHCWWDGEEGRWWIFGLIDFMVHL